MQIRRGIFRSLTSVFCAMVLVLALASTAFGQSSLGSVRGSVRDQTGAVIPLAKLDLVNKATNVTLHAETNESGQYAFPAVLPGQYTLTVTFAGMETLQVGLEVQVQVSTTYNAVLKAGGTETKITVSAELTPLTTTDSPMLGHVLERSASSMLPLNGRDIQQLLVTVPGLELSATANQVRSWGMMAGAHQYILDGAVLEESMWAGKHRHPAAGAGDDPGIQGGEQRLLGQVHPHDLHHHVHQERHQPVARLVVRGQPRQLLRQGPLPHRFRADVPGIAAGTSTAETWADRSGSPSCTTARTAPSSSSRMRDSGLTLPARCPAAVPTAAMRNGDFSGLLDSQGRLTTIYDPWTTNTTTWARQPFNYGGKLNAIDPAGSVR